ncbi:MAG: YtxH domain-containing protein [Mucilaginibacter sp.]
MDAFFLPFLFLVCNPGFIPADSQIKNPQTKRWHCYCIGILYQNRKRMKDQSKVIAALLIGAAAGAALGLLLAPEKGEKVRDDIADYINDLVEAAKDKAQAASSGIKEYGANAYDKAKTKFSSVADMVSDYRDTAVDTAKDKARDLQDRAQGQFEDAKAKAKNGANDLNHSVQNS